MPKASGRGSASPRGRPASKVRPDRRHAIYSRDPDFLFLESRNSVLYLFCMRRFGMTELRGQALAAVDEAAEQTKEGPVRRSLALRFALAFLANFAEDRWPFDNFWRAVAVPDEKVRCTTAVAARNAIRRTVLNGSEEA